MSTKYDFSDAKIRIMVETNHQPEEVWNHAGNRLSDYMQLVEIRCMTCQGRWPCSSIQALRESTERGDPVIRNHRGEPVVM